jgi:predicted lipoprotein with Yx(FWY)xxD motif
MKRTHVLGGVVAAAVLAGGGAALGAALSGPGVPVAAAATAGAPTATGPTVAPSTGVDTAMLAPGTALVDGAGRTLYLFEADTGTTSTCTGACAQVWPPVLVSGPSTGTAGAAQGALVNTSARADGTLQLTYNGHPLYYFAGDKAPGDVKGQGIHNFGGGWYVVTPNGDKIDTDDDAPAAPAPSSGTGYGY